MHLFVTTAETVSTRYTWS